jgi:hypothetical protein
MPLRNKAAKSGSSPASYFPSSAHDKAWEKGFIVPIAKEMKARGVAYLLITIRDDGKAAYVLEPVEAECAHDKGHEMNGVGMWICLGCRADITPENTKLAG